jgi:molybdenum cofactor cytidylyltransferase
MSSSVVGILLAAGQSTRFGSNKLLHTLDDGTPMVLAAARHLSNVLPQTIAVVEDAGNDVATLLTRNGVAVLENSRASEGMGTSIACGVAGNPAAPGWVIALGDMPCIPELIIQAVTAGLEHGADIIAPVCNRQRGHPVGFSARHAQALLQLHDDTGARGIIQANRGSLELIETTEYGVIADMDTRDSIQLAE